MLSSHFRWCPDIKNIRLTFWTYNGYILYQYYRLVKTEWSWIKNDKLRSLDKWTLKSPSSAQARCGSAHTHSQRQLYLQSWTNSCSHIFSSHGGILVHREKQPTQTKIASLWLLFHRLTEIKKPHFLRTWKPNYKQHNLRENSYPKKLL